MTMQTTSWAALAAFLFAAGAAAQEANPNGVNLTVSQNLTYGNNLEFNEAERSGFRAVTGLNLEYSSQNSIEGFTFSASTNAEFGTDDGADNSFADPTFSARYTRQSKNADVNAQLNFRRAEVTSILGSQALIDAGFITIDSGIQTDVGGSLGLTFGKTDPIGGSLTYNVDSRRYTDTQDPDLLDLTNRSLNARVNLRFDPRINGRITASRTEFKEEGGITRNTTSFGAGVALAVNQSLTVDASVSQNETEKTEGGVTTTSDGLGYTIQATQDLKDGELTGRLSSSVNENGRRTTVSVGRTYELKNGSLNFSLGGVRREEGGFNPTYTVGYSQNLNDDARFSISATQSFDTSGTGEEAINSNLTASYSRPLTSVSNISANANYRRTDGIGANTDDVTRYDLGVTYSHDLAQEWDVVGGYNRSFAREDGAADKVSDTLFIGVQKAFQWRP